MHLPQKQRIGAAIACVVLFGSLSFVGARAFRGPEPLAIKEVPGPALESPNPAPVVATPTPVSAASELVIHVIGRVKNPGLYHLPVNSRVDDALKAAGGALPDANLEGFNLAAKLEDGSQLEIKAKGAKETVAVKESIPEPYRGHQMPVAYTSPKPVASKPAGARKPKPSESSSQAKGSEVVSLNKGTLADFQTLPGVGPATAEKILAYRQEHGGFSSIEEIQAVKGIGPKKFEKMRPFLKL